MRTDTELLDGLEALVQKGDCPGIINDDAGRWAVSGSGVQNCPDGDEAIDIQTTFFVEAAEWQPTIRLAIEAYLTNCEKDSSDE